MIRELRSLLNSHINLSTLETVLGYNLVIELGVAIESPHPASSSSRYAGG